MNTRIQMISVGFTVQLNQFKTGVDEATKRTEKFKERAVKAFQAIDNAASKVGGAIVSTFSRVAVESAKTGFSLIKLKDNAMLAFTAFTGSTETARKHLEDLQAFAAKTPFELPGLIQASMKLQNAGLAADKVVPSLTAIGDAVALVGGDSEIIDRVTTQLTQMMNNGKFSTEEMKTMAEAGIPAWQALANVMGVSVAEAQKQVTDGAVSTSKYFDAFVAEVGRKAKGAMAAQSNSLGGLLSTLNDNFAAASATIFEPLYRGANNFIAWATGPNGLTLGDTIKTLQGSVRQISDSLFGFLRQNGQTIVNGLATAFVQAAEGIANFAKSLEETGPAIVETAAKWGSWLTSVLEFLAKHPELLAALGGIKLLFATGIPQAIIATVQALMALSGVVGMRCTGAM